MVQLTDIVLSIGLQSLQLLQSSPSSSIGVPRLMVGYDYQHLYWSGAGRTSQEIAYQAPVSKHFLPSAIMWGFDVCR